jgi:uncharacterized protein (TIGR03086 family)
MSEISERYARHAAAFAATIADVPADRWDSPSPCSEWTARGVVEHIVQVHGMFLGLVGRRLFDGADFAQASAVVQADLEDPVRAGETYEGMFGTATFESSVDSFVTMDLVVHRWDLGTAAGLDIAIPAEEVALISGFVEKMPADVRASGTVFGPALDAPEGSDDQTRMLAAIGRKGW